MKKKGWVIVFTIMSLFVFAACSGGTNGGVVVTGSWATSHFFMGRLEVDQNTANGIMAEINNAFDQLGQMLFSTTSQRSSQRGFELIAYINKIRFGRYPLLEEYAINMTYFHLYADALVSNLTGTGTVEIYVSENQNQEPTKAEIQSMAKCVHYTLNENGEMQFVFDSHSAGGQLIMNTINDSVNQGVIKTLYFYTLASFSEDIPEVDVVLNELTPEVRVTIN